MLSSLPFGSLSNVLSLVPHTNTLELEQIAFLKTLDSCFNLFEGNSILRQVPRRYLHVHWQESLFDSSSFLSKNKQLLYQITNQNTSSLPLNIITLINYNAFSFSQSIISKFASSRDDTPPHSTKLYIREEYVDEKDETETF